MTRAEAARINGAKSNGPKTEAGKAKSSQNAMHYGLNACEVVIPGEDPEEYDAHLRDMHDTWCPATLVEGDLVGEMAAARWRLRRVATMEQAVYEAAFQRAASAPDSQTLTEQQLASRAICEITESNAMKQVHRHETRLRRAWEKAKTELETLISNRILDERRAESRANHERALAEANALAARAQAEWEAKQKKLANQQQHPVQNEPGKPIPVIATQSVQNEPEAREPAVAPARAA